MYDQTRADRWLTGLEIDSLSELRVRSKVPKAELIGREATWSCTKSGSPQGGITPEFPANIHRCKTHVRSNASNNHSIVLRSVLLQVRANRSLIPKSGELLDQGAVGMGLHTCVTI
jgi:hypothetical protein